MERLVSFYRRFVHHTWYNSLKPLRWFWRALLVGLAISFLFIISVFFTGIPSFEDLENPRYNLASLIYDAKGRQYGKYYIENREPITFDTLNPYIRNAVIATEDARFFNHSGIDFFALSRVAVKSVLFQNESSGGGSTITQQLAKLLFERPNMKGRNFFVKTFLLITSKLKEWVIAVKLEKSYTKEEILMMYLNKFEFINGAHGVQSACQNYFGKDQSQITLPQAALLAGMLKNPSRFNPLKFAERSKERRNVVLDLMEDYDYISKAQRDSSKVLEIDMSNFFRAEQSDGPAPYFRVELTKWLKQTLEEQNIRKPDGTPYNIYTDGLKIYTTIDLDYQRYAEEASSEHMAWLQEYYWKDWKGKNEWTYEADTTMRKIRYESLDSHMKASERYLNLRKRYLGDALDVVARKHHNVPMSDNIIQYLRTVKDFSTVDKGILEEPLISKYKALQNSELWPKIVNAYDELQLAYKKAFDTPVKMQVFDHKTGEKEVVMSPKDSTIYSARHLQNAILAIEPKSGEIKAWVGGFNHKYFKYDHVNSRRSVGSTIKPFVYSAAMSFTGISPCQEFEDIQYTIAPGDANFNVDKEWTPANSTEIFTGNMYNLYHGLLYSKNSITVRLLQEMGNVEILRDLLNRVGIDKNERLPNGHLAVPKVPAIALGAIDVSLLKMAGAYTTFANQGTYSSPIFVTRIEDKNGKIIYQGNSTKTPAINPLYNAVMVDMLKNNVAKDFSMGLKTPNGGKTGTTNDYSDGWFMGVTPNLVVGVWTGGDDKWIRFTNIDIGQGYVTARPAFQRLMKKLEADTTGIYDYHVDFAKPPKGFDDLVNCAKYKTIRPESERRNSLNEKVKTDEFDDEFE